MKDYTFTNNFGSFTIREFDNGTYSIYGNIQSASHEFRQINRLPPNKYGNFFGREKAGFSACAELIKKLTEEATNDQN